MKTIGGIIIFIVIFVFIALVGSAGATNNVKSDSFDIIQQEVKDVFKEVTGKEITTQTVEIDMWDPRSLIVAYCRPGDGNYPTYITFNHNLLNNYNDGIKFQVLLHEYVHCEFRIGHIQVDGHFMNDGGNPRLSKEETISQFQKFKNFMFDYWNIKEVVKAEVDQFLPFKMNKVKNIEPMPKPFLDINHLDIQIYIKQNEGMKFKAYLDFKGYLTGGIGHKILGTKYKVGDRLSAEQIATWFQADYNSAMKCAKSFLRNEYGHNELKVVTDMAFNMGCTTLYDFKLFRKHINNRDYVMASKAIKGSNYYKQVTTRAKRNIALLNQ